MQFKCQCVEIEMIMICVHPTKSNHSTKRKEVSKQNKSKDKKRSNIKNQTKIAIKKIK